MLRKLFVAATAMGLFLFAHSQEASVNPASIPAGEVNPGQTEKKSTTILTVSADAYYKYDFGKSKANNLTSFTNSHNSFELGMASVKIEHSFGKVSAVADLGFGKRGTEFSYNDEGVPAAIKQLYISYAPAGWIKFTIGSWATHVGYELVDAYSNRNYSMSYMFTNGPFLHTGLKADVTRGKNGFMIGVANPTDYKFVPDGGLNKKFLIAQYSYAFNDKWKAYLNYAGGQAPDTTKSRQVDLVVTGAMSNKFSIGYNGTIAKTKLRNDGKFLDTQEWWGSAVYLNVDPAKWFGLTLRGEYFSDKDDLKYFSNPEGGSIFATTLSANFKIDNLTIIPEFRLDNASQTIFTKANGDATKSAGNFLLAAVYKL